MRRPMRRQLCCGKKTDLDEGHQCRRSQTPGRTRETKVEIWKEKLYETKVVTCGEKENETMIKTWEEKNNETKVEIWKEM